MYVHTNDCTICRRLSASVVAAFIYCLTQNYPKLATMCRGHFFYAVPKPAKKIRETSSRGLFATSKAMCKVSMVTGIIDCAQHAFQILPGNTVLI